ncbi:MAG TPA: Uma2 family endonuclease [Ktedonobacteraceae bacterium]|nr:Uma2 family endonuclease [Ktedonobacteraceae bacterium]
MVADPYRSVMSVKEYFELDRSSTDVRYEFIDGHIYMLAGGTANHSIIAANMIRELGFLLRSGPCRVYTSDMKVKLSEKRYVYPDVAVSCDEHDTGSVEIIQNPCLIVEVLSPSTESTDRGKKFTYYRACPSIREYIMVDTQMQAVEMYRRASENLWTLHLFGADDQVALASLGISFSVASLYENVIVPRDAPDDF